MVVFYWNENSLCLYVCPHLLAPSGKGFSRSLVTRTWLAGAGGVGEWRDEKGWAGRVTGEMGLVLWKTEPLRVGGCIGGIKTGKMGLKFARNG